MEVTWGLRTGFRYLGGSNAAYRLTEAVGDADAVEATRLGIKNLERIAGLLLNATTTEPGAPYSDLGELYGRMLAQWSLEMNHVAAIVGGYSSQQKHIGQQGVRFEVIPRMRQEMAVTFLVDHAFHPPAWALDPDVLRRIEPVGVIGRVEQNQARVLNSLLSTARVQRLVEQTAVDGAAAYDPLDFLADVRRGVWSEIYAPAPIDAYRRSLQRAYVETLGNRVNGPQAQADDTRAFFRGELRALDEDLRVAASRQADRATTLHLEDVRMQIARALDPTVPPPGGAPSTILLTAGDPEFDVTIAPDICWPEHGATPARAPDR